MAKGVYACIDSVSRNVKQIPLCVDLVSRNTKEGWACIDGVSRQFFSGGIALGDLEIGTSVYTNVNGALKEFIIVHQGLPSTAYDTSCDGTWLLMKEGYAQVQWNPAPKGNTYATSAIHTYLNDTFYNLLDEAVKEVVKQVKIPYASGTSNSTNTIYTGSNGLSTRIFLPSYSEVGLTGNTTTEGSRLSYFSSGKGDAANTKRIAYSNGTAIFWHTRSPSNYTPYSHGGIHTTGGPATFTTSDEWSYARPAMIMPSETLIDKDFNIIA